MGYIKLWEYEYYIGAGNAMRQYINMDACNNVHFIYCTGPKRGQASYRAERDFQRWIRAVVTQEQADEIIESEIKLNAYIKKTTDAIQARRDKHRARINRIVKNAYIKYK
jgi:hypothetical protein